VAGSGEAASQSRTELSRAADQSNGRERMGGSARLLDRCLPLLHGRTLAEPAGNTILEVALQTIIGLKRLDIAKQRLMPHLSPTSRRELMISMLEAVVAAAHEAGLGPVALATSEPTAATLAAQLQVAILSDGDLPWNDGLVHALSSLAKRPTRVLYLAGDVPLVTAAELREFVAAAPARGVCIARARDAGTNALMITPSNALRPAFGAPHSSEVHRAAARAARLPCRVVDIPGLALDVDTLDDARDAGLRLHGINGTGRAPGGGSPDAQTRLRPPRIRE
jgi:2-phospho-L-lactate guanylyltransferase